MYISEPIQKSVSIESVLTTQVENHAALLLKQRLSHIQNARILASEELDLDLQSVHIMFFMGGFD